MGREYVDMSNIWVTDLCASFWLCVQTVSVCMSTLLWHVCSYSCMTEYPTASQFLPLSQSLPVCLSQYIAIPWTHTAESWQTPNTPKACQVKQMLAWEKVNFTAFWYCFSQVPPVQLQVGFHTIKKKKCWIHALVQNVACFKFLLSAPWSNF